MRTSPLLHVMIIIPFLWVGSISSLSMRSSPFRNQIAVSQNGRCGHCGAPFNFETTPRDIHHRDGNRTNNARYNLVALCCNCHQSHHRYGVCVDVLHPLCRKKNIPNDEERTIDV